MADRTISVRLQALIAPYSAAMAKARKDTVEFKNELGKAAREGSDFTKQLGTGMLVAGGAVALGFGKMISTGMGFEKQMAGVRAVSGASADEMDRLSEAALAAGASTKLAGVTAADAAAAQAELVKAGVSVDQVLGGALMGSLTLAAAGQLEFADAATIAAQAMNIFELSGSEVTHVADVLAAAANKSAGDVGQFGDALRQGGLVAKQTGLSLEETVGALAAFADNALIGSDAGTSLKTMLQRLTPQSDEAAALMEQLGFSAYDAGGEFIGLEGLARELQEALGNMTVQQRNAAMSVLFGSDAVRAANILYEQGAEGIREYVSAVDDVGAAAEMAAIQNDNLSGDIEALGGAIETFLIKGAGQANGVLRDFTQTLTTMATGIGSVEGPAGTAVVGLTGLVGAASLAGGATLHLAPKIHYAKEALKGMGDLGEFTARNMGKFAGALGVAGIAVGVLTWHLGRQAEKQAEAEEAARGYTEAIKEQGSEVGRLTDELALQGVLEGGLGEALREAEADLSSFTDTLRTAPNELMALDEAVNDVALLMGGAAEQTNNLRDALRDAGLSGTAFADELLRLSRSGDLTASQIDTLIGRVSAQAQAHQVGAREARNQEAATDASGAAAEDAVPKVGEYADALADAKSPAEQLEEAIKGITDALKAQMDPWFAATDAVLGHQDAQNAVAEAQWEVLAAQVALDEAIKEHGRNSDEAKEAAWALAEAEQGVDEANRDAVRSAMDLDLAMRDLKTRVDAGAVSAEAAAAQLQTWVDQGLITEQQAREMGEAMGFAGFMADELGKKAPVVRPLLDTAQFYRDLGDLQAALRFTQLSAQQSGARAPGLQLASGGLVPQYRALGGPIYRAAGGPSGTDTVPAWLTPGEYVVRKSAVDAVGVGFLDSMNRATPATVRPATTAGSSAGSTIHAPITVNYPKPERTSDSMVRVGRKLALAVG